MDQKWSNGFGFKKFGAVLCSILFFTVTIPCRNLIHRLVKTFLCVFHMQSKRAELKFDDNKIVCQEAGLSLLILESCSYGRIDRSNLCYINL